MFQSKQITLKWYSKREFYNGNLQIEKDDNAKVYANQWFAQWFAAAKSSADRFRNAYKTCWLLRVLKIRTQAPAELVQSATFLL